MSLLQELEGVLGSFAALPSAARDAVVASVATLVAESGTSDEEREAAIALLALAKALPRGG
jgi:hypothetical protein